MFTLTMTFFQVDISNQTQMSSLKDRLQSLPDVAGIVHTAMVLRDEFLKDLTSQSFKEVMGPKIKGKTIGVLFTELLRTSQKCYLLSEQNFKKSK